MAGSREAVGVGFVFVLSAALAREYDGHDLVHEPIHLAIPFAASLGASFALYCVVFVAAKRRAVAGMRFVSSYLSFLGLFWMTAPLAWLYGVPYERFLSPMGAMQTNLITLAVVAVWRVTLMVRVIHVWTGLSVARCVFMVMAFADIALLAVLRNMPLLVVMSGIRVSPEQALLSNVGSVVFLIGVYSLPIWVIGALSAVISQKVEAGAKLHEIAAAEKRSRGALTVAAIAVFAWGCALPFAQPEQRLRFVVERDLREGRIGAAIDSMSAHDLSDFPPSWRPVPRSENRDNSPPLIDVMEALAARPAAAWVRDYYVGLFSEVVTRPWGPWWELEGEGVLARVRAMLERLPEGPGIVEECRDGVLAKLENDRMPEADREALRGILELGDAK